MVGRSIADIYDPRRHIYRGAKRQDIYAAEVGYRGYRPTYRIMYNTECISFALHMVSSALSSFSYTPPILPPPPFASSIPPLHFPSPSLRSPPLPLPSPPLSLPHIQLR